MTGHHQESMLTTFVTEKDKYDVKNDFRAESYKKKQRMFCFFQLLFWFETLSGICV